MVEVEAVGRFKNPGVGSRAVVVEVLSEGGALSGEGLVSSTAFWRDFSSGSSISAGGVKLGLGGAIVF